MSSLVSRIRSREAVVGVIGLGYVGLPLLILFGRKGFPVLGFDTDEKKVRLLRRGRSYIGTVGSSDVRRWARNATADFRRLSECDAIVICVPTPVTVDRRPDLRYVERTARTIAQYHRSGALVVLESTTYPGTTRDVVAPILRGSGRPFLLAYSPERVDPGHPRRTAERTPRLVAGVDEESTLAAEALYRSVIPRVVRVSRPEVAEAAKLLENIFRAVNIALVNEMKMILDRMGIDIWEVIRAAETKPYGFMPFYPGPGWGGHCIPVDPFYLSWVARRHGVPARFIELAGEINVQMPHYVVSRLEEVLAKNGRSLRGARVLVLGIAYKKDVDDPRESPAFEVIRLLVERGARWEFHDPHIPVLPAMRRWRLPRRRAVPLRAALLRRFDAAVIVTDHSRMDYDLVVRHVPLVVDTRNVIRRNVANVVRA